MSEIEINLPPYEGGPLHNPGTPGQNQGIFAGLAESIKTLKEEQDRVETERLRKVVREEVHRALYPDAALANPHEHMRVEMTTEQGEKWRGVLYAVDEGEK